MLLIRVHCFGDHCRKCLLEVNQSQKLANSILQLLEYGQNMLAPRLSTEQTNFWQSKAALTFWREISISKFMCIHHRNFLCMCMHVRGIYSRHILKFILLSYPKIIGKLLSVVSSHGQSRLKVSPTKKQRTPYSLRLFAPRLRILLCTMNDSSLTSEERKYATLGIEFILPHHNPLYWSLHQYNQKYIIQFTSSYLEAQCKQPCRKQTKTIG